MRFPIPIRYGQSQPLTASGAAIPNSLQPGPAPETIYLSLPPSWNCSITIQSTCFAGLPTLTVLTGGSSVLWKVQAMIFTVGRSRLIRKGTGCLHPATCPNGPLYSVLASVHRTFTTPMRLTAYWQKPLSPAPLKKLSAKKSGVSIKYPCGLRLKNRQYIPGS